MSHEELVEIRNHVTTMVERRFEVLGITDNSRVDVIEWLFEDEGHLSGQVKAWSKEGGFYVVSVESEKETPGGTRQQPPLRLDTSLEEPDLGGWQPDDVLSLLEAAEKFTDTHFTIRARF